MFDFAHILHANSDPREKQLCQILEKSVKYFSSYGPPKKWDLTPKIGGIVFLTRSVNTPPTTVDRGHSNKRLCFEMMIRSTWETSVKYFSSYATLKNWNLTAKIGCIVLRSRSVNTPTTVIQTEGCGLRRQHLTAAVIQTEGCGLRWSDRRALVHTWPPLDWSRGQSRVTGGWSGRRQWPDSPDSSCSPASVPLPCGGGIWGVNNNNMKYIVHGFKSKNW